MQKLYSENMERALLGCMLVNNEIIDDVFAKIKKEYFQVGIHSIFFDNIVNLYSTHGSCDIVMLSQAVPQYVTKIAELTTDIASTANYEAYIATIKNFYIARKYNQFFLEKQSALSSKTIDDILYETDDFIGNCMNSSSRLEPVDSKHMALSVIENLMIAQKRNGALQGYDTGFEGLNDKLGGITTGNLYIIGARPSIGKSAFMDKLAINLARNGAKVVGFSLEMTQKELQIRRASMLSGVPSKRIKSGYVTGPQITRINDACQIMFDLDMLLYDSSQIGFDFNEIVSRIRVLAKKGYKIFYIDHIGLLEYPDGVKMQEWERISHMTKKLKKLAATLNIAIFAVCQLTRDTEGREPELNSLRGSGSLEQDSNIVMFLHRERQHNNETEIIAKLIIAKNRDGECGVIDMKFLTDTVNFVEVDPSGKIVIPHFDINQAKMIDNPPAEEPAKETAPVENKEKVEVFAHNDAFNSYESYSNDDDDDGNYLDEDDEGLF